MKSGNGECLCSVPSGCAQDVGGEQKRVISTRVGAHGRLPGGVTKTEDEKKNWTDKKGKRDRRLCTMLSSGPSRALIKCGRQLLSICCTSEERATHVRFFLSVVLAFSRAVWKHDTLSLCKCFQQEQTVGRKSLRTDDVSVKSS